MFYRVVMQGRTLDGADLEEVKQHFARVTGLPLGVAEQMFGGMPQVIKRQVPRPDAERIAATLRAIGAAATVEREVLDAEDESPEGIRVVATPLNNGPPTVIPGTERLPEIKPARSRHAKLLRKLGDQWPWLAGATMLVPAAILLAPFAEDFLADTQRAPGPARAMPARVPTTEIAEAAPVINVTLLSGPWRCTDQRTGVSTYWSYVANGTLIFHGDVLSDRPPPATVTANAPTEWVLDGQRLMHKYPQRASDTYRVTSLSLARLQYGDERKLEIECRRP